RRHTRFSRDWSSDVCSSDLQAAGTASADNRSGRLWIGVQQLVLAQHAAELVIAQAEQIGGALLVVASVGQRLLQQTGFECRDLRSEERRVGKVARAVRWRVK